MQPSQEGSITELDKLFFASVWVENDTACTGVVKIRQARAARKANVRFQKLTDLISPQEDVKAKIKG